MENLKNVAPIEDFNWDAYENGEAVTSASHEELEKAYDGTLNKVNDREVVDGTVIAMNKREVVVNIGYKSDGIIPLNEFRYNPDLKVGDTVEVYIENQEDKKGQLVLSHRKARATRSWDRVNAALENEEIIKGFIKCRTKGGMIVDVFGIEAFLPGSQIDVKPIRDYDVFVVPVVNTALMSARERITFMSLGTGFLMELSSAPQISHPARTSHTAIRRRSARLFFSSIVPGAGSPKISARTGQKRLRG